MSKSFLVFFISCFLMSCTHTKKTEDLCINYHDEKNKIKSEKVQSNDVNVQTYDIASFVREHGLYLKYDFKTMSERYKSLKSTYLKFKVLENLSSDLGFDNGTLFNSYIKDDSNYQSELEVGVTGQGPNTNYYSSSNLVPNDAHLIESFNKVVQDQLFIVIGKKVDENEINKLVQKFIVKGNCINDKGNAEVIVENNFNGIHIILESNVKNFRENNFSFNIYYITATDKKYENSLYW